ncbi:MAG: thiamine pyrophosphate-binding protein [Candidatus Margulisbacteria bacterium]|nr:thiamine pyrophosphate-binding protein [Candidatus Margulisiibacteriota bacterium]
MTIKLSDYIVKRLEEYKVRHIFMISGGGAMHLNDSIGKSKSIKYICNHHEQGCAIAAEGYSRIFGDLGVVCVTTGPGGTNALTGVIGQWLDSVPVLYLSGQVKFETTIASCPNIPLRQLGDQEINIVDMVKPVTKYAVMVTDPQDIKYCLEKAIYLATNGRPGPVWLDIPLNVQSAMIDEKKLKVYKGTEDELIFDSTELTGKLNKIISLLKTSQRPVVLAGRGIRVSDAQSLFLQLIKKLQIPVLTTFNNVDIIPSDHELFIGRVGTVGDRAGNFALQNADLLISIGSRNNIRQIGYNWQTYARHAKKVIVDIDAAELQKSTVLPDIAVRSDAKQFLQMLDKQLYKVKLPSYKTWLEWCVQRKIKYPVVLPEYEKQQDLINPYYFIQQLNEQMKENDILVAGNGTACVAEFQAGIIKKGQRVFWNSGCASMGYDLPAAIGAAVASDKNVICLAGDGSLQMNLQELQTVKQNNLPIKLFYLNNEGYISIKQTQDNFFEGRRIACDCGSGVSFPSFQKIAAAFDLTYACLDKHKNIRGKIKQVLDKKGPVLCEVKLSTDYKFMPKLSSEKKPDGRMVSKPLEDMWPFLDRQEFADNMLVPLWPEQ